MYKCKYFNIKELVSKQVYDYYTKRYGMNFCWKFFQVPILKELDKIREYHGLPIIINNWHLGGTLSQCGLRSNIEPLVKTKTTPYCSAHTLACGFDLHSSDNKKLYHDIEHLINTKQLEYFMRLESPESTKYKWVHVDGMQTVNGALEVFLG